MKKVALIIFIFFTGCPLNIDIEGMPCTDPPEFACAPGYTCRWVSGEPRCLSEGAENPNPLLYEENFDDGVADGLTFNTYGDSNWNISSGILNIQSPTQSSVSGYLEDKAWHTMFVEVRFQMHASHEVDFDGYYGGLININLENRKSGGGFSCSIVRNEGTTSFKLWASSYPSIYQSCTRDITISAETWYTLQMEIADDHMACRIIETDTQVEGERISEETYVGTFTFSASEYDLSLDDLKIYSEKPSVWPNFTAVCSS